VQASAPPEAVIVAKAAMIMAYESRFRGITYSKCGVAASGGSIEGFPREQRPRREQRRRRVNQNRTYLHPTLRNRAHGNYIEQASRPSARTRRRSRARIMGGKRPWRHCGPKQHRKGWLCPWHHPCGGFAVPSGTAHHAPIRAYVPNALIADRRRLPPAWGVRAVGGRFPQVWVR
jgi:hypothetical protein